MMCSITFTLLHLRRYLVQYDRQNATTNTLSTHLHCRIRLRKCPRQRLNAIRDPLELILLLARNLIHHIRRRIIIAVAPLDFHSIEIDLDI